MYEADGVKVTAFLVDHGPVKPAFGYRIDYRGRSVAALRRHWAITESGEICERG